VTESSPLFDPAALKREARALIKLAGPIVLAQLGMFSMGFVDTMMVGHVSPEALAAIALGNMYCFSFTIVGIGLLSALDPIVAQAVGAKDDLGISRAVQRGVVLAILLLIPLSVALLSAGPVLVLLQQPESVRGIAAEYARLTLAGVPAFLLFVVFRRTLQAMHHVRPLIWGVIGANIANIGLNYLLIFGKAGFPELGPIGSAHATVGARWALLIFALLAGRKHLLPRLRPWHPEVFELQPLWRVCRIGIPIGIHHMVEIGTFSAVALFMGWLGVMELASHQVAIQLASLTFMIPMGISTAAAVRVGHAVGRGDSQGARQAGVVSLLTGVAVMCVTSACFALFPRPLASLFSEDHYVVDTAASLLMVAAVFQIFDGIQVVAVGVLRGVGDTKAPMLINLAGFWALGIPASLLLAFRFEVGAVGLWWGLVVGLGVVAVILLLRVRTRMAGELQRLEV
jgi:MATE family multidrug resistance protein